MPITQSRGNHGGPKVEDHHLSTGDTASSKAPTTDASGLAPWSAAGGGGTPGGSNTQIQYNNAGAFGGTTGATTSGGAVTLAAPVIADFTAATHNHLAAAGGATLDAAAIASGQIPVVRGGTGAFSFTDGGVMVGNGTGALQVTAIGSAGQVLMSAGSGDPAFQYVPMNVAIVASASVNAWTNMPAADSFFDGSTGWRSVFKIDLTYKTQVRLLVVKAGVSGAATANVGIRYKTTSMTTTIADYVIMGASEVQVAVNATNTLLDSGWINLVAGAKADVFVAPFGTGGDGVLDPEFGAIHAQFR